MVGLNFQQSYSLSFSHAVPLGNAAHKQLEVRQLRPVSGFFVFQFYVFPHNEFSHGKWKEASESLPGTINFSSFSSSRIGTITSHEVFFFPNFCGLGEV